MLLFSAKLSSGRSSMNCAVRLLGALVADTSSSGASALTLTVSEVEPISNLKFTRKLLWAFTKMGSRTTVRKPSFRTIMR